MTNKKKIGIISINSCVMCVIVQCGQPPRVDVL